MRADLATGVALLAHRRLKHLARALTTRINQVDVEIDVADNRGPVAHRDVEARVRALVDAAVTMLEAGAPIPMPANSKIGHGVGRAVVTGTFGTTLPAIVAQFDADRGWYHNAIHRGSGDPNLSRLAVPSTELVLDIGARALRAAADEPQRAIIRALILGMLADIATRVVVTPVLRGAAADEGFADVDLSVSASAVNAGALTAGRLMGGRAGATWSDWWLPRAQVPEAFFQGYAEAIAALEAVSEPTPLGFRAYLETFPRGRGMTAEQLGRAYDLFRGGSFDRPGAVPVLGARWNLGEWFAMMIPAFIPPAIALLESAGHDRSKLLWNERTSLDQPDTTSWLELAALGGLWGAAPALIYPMLMWLPAQTYPFWETIAFTLVRLFGGIGGLLAGTDEDWRKGLLVVQLVPDIVAFVQMWFEIGFKHRAPALIMMINLLPAINMGLTMLAGATFREAEVTWDWDSFFPGWLIVLAIGLLLSFIVGAIIKCNGGFRLIDTPSIEHIALSISAQLGSLPTGGTPEPRANALVFDDASMFRIPGLGGNAPTRAHFAYPSGQRRLLDLSWAGRTPLTLRIDGAKLSFKIAGDPPIDVIVPPGTSAAALGQLLVSRVLDGGQPKLTAVPPVAGDLAAPLGFPHPFFDAGDDRPRGEHDAHRNDPVVISSEADNPTELRHSPRAHSAVAFGVRGPATTQLEGWKVVPSAELGDTDQTAMGAAAELAALLFLGAVPDLTAAPLTPPGGPLRPVYEVFRRWNLDERSANEWRTLVAGGARSERVAAVDPLRRPAAQGVNVTDDAAGRALLERMGWIPAWRAWTRMAGDPTQDTQATTSAPFTPPVGTPPTTQAPSNELLSKAIKVLLNL